MPDAECPMPVVPLHVRSAYSLLSGTVLPDRLLARACALGHRWLALTDVDSLCGATVFWRAAEEAGVQPILGAELTEDRRSVVALAADEGGYRNLCRLITRRHAGDNPPAGTSGGAVRVGPLTEDLRELSDGLHLLVEDAALAEELLAAGAERRRVWLGIDPPAQSPGQLRRLTELSERRGLPLAATGMALVPEPGDLEAARLLAAIRLGTTFDGLDESRRPNPRAVLRGPGQLARELAEFPEAVRNNRRLAEECAAFRLLPRRAVFPDFPCPDGLSPGAFLRRLCREGMSRRYDRPPPGAQVRLEKELRLIERLGFAEYFLVVWDIVQFARARGAPVAGRGSGASSLVAYVLGLTNVCPVTYRIPFERFLHEGRQDFPDLDIDFCWRTRDEVIDYAFRRWGRDRVAMVSMHNTFQARSALRETAKAMGLSEQQVSRLEREGGLDADAPAQVGEDPARIDRIVRLSRRLVNLPHNLSVHPGGIVIGRLPIDHYVPVQPAPKGVRITQYDKDGVEDIRLVKLDLLGNRSLSTVRFACDLVRRRTGEAVDIERLPAADPATVALLRSADTVGCNQLESPAMRNLLRMMQPRDTRDVMRALAMIRPGAASIGMKEVFIRRLRGLEAVPRGDERTGAILGDTFGVMLYEDDVMLVAAALTGGSLREADRFRKAVQKCPDDRRREDLSREFLARCRRNGADDQTARGLWVQMAKFNAYSFCRAHAASYALLAYAGAYLKAHHPLEFWTSALNNNQSMYPTRVYVEQAKRAGIRFLLPDANRSGQEFTVEGDAVRTGLGRVGGIGPTGVAAILRAREHGPFAGLADFFARTGLPREEVRALVLCGAFDFTARARPALMLELELVQAGPGPPRGPRGGPGLLPAGPTVPDTPADYSTRRKALDQRRILGFDVNEHVLSWHRPGLAQAVDADSRDLPNRIGRPVRLAGMLEAVRTTTGRNGRDVTFLTFQDEYGLFEVTAFASARGTGAVRPDRYGPYVVSGRVEEQYDVISVSAGRIALSRPSGEGDRAVQAAFAAPGGRTP